MNKEDQREILCRSNLEDWIIFGEISKGDKYSFMVDMGGNHNLPAGFLS